MQRFMKLLSQYKGMSRSAYVIFFAKMITNMGAFIFPMLSLILARKFDYSTTQITWVLIVVGALFLPMTFIGGKLADRFNKKRLIITLDLISVSFFIACAFFEPGLPMLICFIIAGMFANLEGPAFESLIAEITLPSEREKVYSLSYLGHNLGYTLGAVIGGLLVENYLSLAFIFDGITTITSTILIVLFVVELDHNTIDHSEKNDYENHEEQDKPTVSILKERYPVLVQIGIFFLMGFIYTQWTFVLPLYMTTLFEQNAAAYYGYISGFNGLVVIMMTPVLTYLLKDFKEISKMCLGMFLFSMSFLLLLNQPAYWMFFIMIVVFTVGEIINMLGQSPYVSRRVPASHRGRVNAYVIIGYFLGSIIGRFVIGFLVDMTSYNMGFILIAVFGVVAVIVMFFNKKADRRLFPKLYEKA